MSEEAKYRARILRRREITTYTPDEVPVPTMEIMYSTQHLTPGIVRIPVSDYSLEAEAKVMRADIDRRHEEKPEVRQV